MMEVPTQAIWKTSTWLTLPSITHGPTKLHPRLDELGLEATGQRHEPRRAVLACRLVEPDGWWFSTSKTGKNRPLVINLSIGVGGTLRGTQPQCFRFSVNGEALDCRFTTGASDWGRPLAVWWILT